MGAYFLLACVASCRAVFRGVVVAPAPRRNEGGQQNEGSGGKAAAEAEAVGRPLQPPPERSRLAEAACVLLHMNMTVGVAHPPTRSISPPPLTRRLALPRRPSVRPLLPNVVSASVIICFPVSCFVCVVLVVFVVFVFVVVTVFTVSRFPFSVVLHACVS